MRARSGPRQRHPASVPRDVDTGIAEGRRVLPADGGHIGDMAAVATVEDPWLLPSVSSGVTGSPPSRLSAALLGLGASLAVGAVAGLLPALVAVRVSVFHAIRC
ncbi:hypothetical protein [Clavibacter sp. Sh2088]|uniref:hypothetical protein n=1 Tax=Clavibacter sp. Sh2088 TaxID=3397676 RepID=UPI0039DF7D42